MKKDYKSVNQSSEMNKIYRYTVRLLIEDFQEANQPIAKIFVFHVASKNSDSEDLYIYLQFSFLGKLFFRGIKSILKFLSPFEQNF